ncbi:unnamed protein product [Linum tenue]|uniref:Peroxidase n=1 Tax=Linum tenue TaxID=586396 RepID=A0AAV0J705_9ROSI|nr:unnamed protein product [Linum tenue]
MASNKILCLSLLLAAAAATLAAATGGKLSPAYYSTTCPKALAIVQAGVVAAIQKETRIGASLLRLHFHDCFVNGCEASILLDETASIATEKTAVPNQSVRGYDVIDDIKAELEEACPGVVSCADILTLAARDSVVYVFMTVFCHAWMQLGGPSWEVDLGRKDSLTAGRAAVNTSIPPPTFNLTALAASFSSQGLSFRDLISLSGSGRLFNSGHTIGVARCVSFRGHIYNDSDIDPSFAESLQQICPRSGSDGVLAPLDLKTPTHFDNCYYRNLLRKQGLLHSDQELFSGNSEANSIVRTYVNQPSVFFKDFVQGMIKMGNIKLLTGSQGEVRTDCRKVN